MCRPRIFRLPGATAVTHVREKAFALVVQFAALFVGLAVGEAHAAAPAATYRNPILYADYSDPDVIRVGDRYYMVASTFHFSPGLPVLKSKDLVHWTLIGHALARLDFHPSYDLPGPVEFDDAAWNHAWVPAEQVPAFLDLLGRCGLSIEG